MFSRWIVTNITSASVTTFLAFLAGIISWSVYSLTQILKNEECFESLVTKAYCRKTLKAANKHNAREQGHQ
jgi:hypothetical protein